jgi:hypothetical protein
MLTFLSLEFDLLRCAFSGDLELRFLDLDLDFLFLPLNGETDGRLYLEGDPLLDLECAKMFRILLVGYCLLPLLFNAGSCRNVRWTLSTRSAPPLEA